MNSSFTRDQLYYRHQLSHQQIDDWLGENKSTQFPESKAQCLYKLDEFNTLIRLFTDSGIDFIPLKGPLLSWRIYSDPLYRSFNDLDFLMYPGNIQKAANLLEDRGYYTSSFTLPDDECRRNLLYKHIDELPLFHQGRELLVELHWKLFSCNFVSDATLQQIITSNLCRVEYQGIIFSVFPIEFELLYLIIHGGLHHWYKLKWLVDIKDILLRFPIDESLFLKLTGELNAHRLVAVCNELLKEFFPEVRGLPCKTAAQVHLVKFSHQEIKMNGGKNSKSVIHYLTTFWHTARVFPGIRYKINIIKHMIFATDLASVKRLPCSTAIYYLVSPFWKLIRGFR